MKTSPPPLAPPREDLRNHVGRFITERELLRDFLPVSRRTLTSWKAKGWIPFIKAPGGRRVLYDSASVRTALIRLQRGGAE